MGNVIRRPLALQDILAIWRYIATDSEHFADALLDRIDAKLTVLADNPRLGRERPELATDLRSFTLGNYVLYYRPIDGGIDLVRVLHGHATLAESRWSDAGSLSTERVALRACRTGRI